MDYLQLEIINKDLKTTDIKGKNYVEVNERIKAFRKMFPEGSIETQLISNENGVCVFKSMVYDENGKILATGHAYEKENSTFINITSYIENCETSAVGRALGMLGIGIDTSVASAEEVQNAIANQEMKVNSNIINKTKVDALKKSIENNKLAEDFVQNALNNNGFEKIEDITNNKYLDVVNELRKGAE